VFTWDGGSGVSDLKGSAGQPSAILEQSNTFDIFGRAGQPSVDDVSTVTSSDTSLTISNIDLSVDSDYDSPALSVVTAIVINDFDFDVESIYDSPALGASDLIEADNFDLNLNVDFGTSILTIEASILLSNIDFSLDSEYDNVSLTYNAADDTILIMQESNYTVDADSESPALGVAATVAINNFDFVIDSDYDNVLLVYNSAGDTNLITQDFDFSLISDYENATITFIGDVVLIAVDMDFITNVDYSNATFTGIVYFIVEETIILPITKEETIIL
jgi:hypothetical protein